MELRHLRYFVCVAEEGNVSRAAQRLHISQPPLTRQIHQLEAELDTTLFERTARGVTLTHAGQVFLDDARRILAEVDVAAGRAHRAELGRAGSIDVAIFGTALFGAIPRLLRAHRESYPEVTVRLHNMTKREQLAALQDGRIDLAFNRLMRPVPGIVSEVLLTEPLLIALPDDHRLADEPQLDLAVLAGEPMVLFPTGYRPSFIDRVQDMCARAGFVPRVIAEVDDIVHGIAHVAIGGATGIVPYSATYLHIPGVAYVPLRDAPDNRIDLCGVYRQGDPSPVLRHLLQSMRDAAPGILALQRSTLAGRR